MVIRFSALGDVAMAVPVVWALATQYPDVRITVLSRAFAHRSLKDRAADYGGQLNLSGEIEWASREGSEVW